MYPKHLQQFIPPNFNLSKYDKAANLELGSWIENLFSRLLSFAASEKALDEKTKTLIEGITQNNIGHGVLLNSQFSAFLNILILEDDAEHASVVREITYFELFTMSDSLKTEAMSELYSEVKSSIFPLINQKELGKLNDAFPVQSQDEEEHLSWLQIDMNCSDSEITAAFSGWLKQARTKAESEIKKTKRREIKLKSFNKVTFRKWHDAKVLAYIDLVTWNALKGNKITSKALGDILFPNPRDLRDTTALINDTIKPLAKKLMSLPTLRRMFKVLADQSRKKIT